MPLGSKQFSGLCSLVLLVVATCTGIWYHRADAQDSIQDVRGVENLKDRLVGHAAEIPRNATDGSDGATQEISVQDMLERSLDWAVTIRGDGIFGGGTLIWPEEGYVLTNQHVIDGVSGLTVSFADGQTVKARVIEQDKKYDLAILKIPPQKRLRPQIGEALALRPGDELFTVGCPHKMAFSVSRGIASYVGRSVEGEYYVQSDLPINEGNSGGPVFNRRGEVIGVMSFVIRNTEGLSFALPVDYAMDRFGNYFPTDQKLISQVERFRHWRTSHHNS